MSGLEQLLEAVDAAQALGEEAVLATVVKVEGSAYRRPGARMLINALGQTAGTVSGGCLESEVARTAWWLTERGPALRSYSTAEDAEDGDAAVRFGLGCNGTVHLLFERVHSPACQLLLDACRDLSSPKMLATVVNTVQPQWLGQRLLLEEGGALRGSLPASVQAQLQPVLEQARHARRASLHAFELADGKSLDVLVEPLRAARRLVIFGGGHDAQPLVRMARLQGLHVTLIDSRAHFARASRFTDAHVVLHKDLAAADSLMPLLEDAAVVIMTHSLQQDACWLALALRSSACYIGQLGPRERTERLLASAERPLPAQLHYPVGLDLGGDTPEAVALSVLAEITAVLHQRQGGKLHARRSAIHDPVTIERHARVASLSLSENSQMSDTITIVAVLRAADGAAEKVAGILHRAVAPSRAEAGCRGYVLHHDRSDHQRFVFVEQWADMAAIEAHRQAPHYLAMGKALDGLIAEREVMLLDAVP